MDNKTLTSNGYCSKHQQDIELTRQYRYQKKDPRIDPLFDTYIAITDIQNECLYCKCECRIKSELPDSYQQFNFERCKRKTQ